MKRLLMITIASAALATPVVAIAADDGNVRHSGAMMFDRLDADNDGKITREEMENPAAARFAATDTDGNGELSVAELEQRAVQAATRRVARMVERLDTDGSGGLSAAELEARRGPGAMFDRIDANDDGAISEDEFAQMRQHRRPHRRHGNDHSHGE